jgi:hypothetical protein
MLYLADTKGVYSPEVITDMATAFDRVCQFFPELANGNDEVRQQWPSETDRFRKIDGIVRL